MNYLAIYYYYLGEFRTVALFVYVACFFGWRHVRTISLTDLIIVFFVLVKTMTSLQDTSIWVEFFYLRLYWGFLFFYFYFKGNPQNLERLFHGMILTTIAEYLLVFIFPDSITFLPNYTQIELLKQHYENSGLAGGVHSFGGNRTVSGVILLAVHAYMRQHAMSGSRLALLASILCFSGVAFGLTLLYYIGSNVSLRQIPIIVLTVLAGYYIMIEGEEIFYRASFSYLTDVIFEYKTDQVIHALNILNAHPGAILYGTHYFEVESAEIAGYGVTFGDFLFLEFFLNYGILGVLVFFIFLTSKMNRRNVFPLLILTLGTFHYHIIYAMPGQLIFGYFLSIIRNRTDTGDTV